MFLWMCRGVFELCVRFFSKFRMLRDCCVRVLCVEGLSVFVSGFFTGFIALSAVKLFASRGASDPVRKSNKQSNKLKY